jgi:GNAT superfamily N-acetyltransferase
VSDEGSATSSGVRIAQRVGPEQVGQRVVLRRRLPDGSAGDLLGDLLRWDVGGPGPVVTVRTRAGDVTVAVEDVLGGKPVPPAPARRGRPHRTVDWMTLEDVASDGWRPLEQHPLVPGRYVPGWRLRAAEGFTGRANSVLALGDPGLPLGEAVAEVERWYAARDLPPRFAVPWPLTVRWLRADGEPTGIDTDLDRELAGRDYRLDTPTLVLTAAAREVAVAATPVGGGPVDVRLDEEPDDGWLAVYHYRGQALPSVARTLLLSAPHQVFASLRQPDGSVAAVARGASSRGWTGITAMEVEPGHRRRGLARQLIGALATWALDRGDQAMYLQVAETNAAARRLYDTVGFAPHHGYHYRVR